MTKFIYKHFITWFLSLFFSLRVVVWDWKPPATVTTRSSLASWKDTHLTALHPRYTPSKSHNSQSSLAMQRLKIAWQNLSSFEFLEIHSKTSFLPFKHCTPNLKNIAGRGSGQFSWPNSLRYFLGNASWGLFAIHSTWLYCISGSSLIFWSVCVGVVFFFEGVFLVILCGVSCLDYDLFVKCSLFKCLFVGTLENSTISRLHLPWTTWTTPKEHPTTPTQQKVQVHQTAELACGIAWLWMCHAACEPRESPGMLFQKSKTRQSDASDKPFVITWLILDGKYGSYGLLINSNCYSRSTTLVPLKKTCMVYTSSGHTTKADHNCVCVCGVSNWKYLLFPCLRFPLVYHVCLFILFHWTRKCLPVSASGTQNVNWKRRKNKVTLDSPPHVLHVGGF